MVKKPKLRGRGERINVDDADFPKPGDESLGAIIKRIDRKLLRGGLSDRAASLAAGHSADLIRAMRRQYRLDKVKGISPRVLRNLAVAFQTTPEWLRLGQGPEDVAAVGAASNLEMAELEAHHGAKSNNVAFRAAQSTLVLRGVVAAETWQPENGTLERGTSLLPDPRYPAAQFAVELRDNSLSRIGANDGDILIVADLIPRAGDLVLTTRKRQNHLRERAVRRLINPSGGTVLVAESDDPRLAAAVALDSTKPGRAKDGTVVTFDGVVIGIYRALG